MPVTILELLFLGCLLISNSHAGELSFDNNVVLDGFGVNTYVEYYGPVDDSVGLTEISQNKDWKVIADASELPHYSQDAYWFRMNLHNNRNRNSVLLLAYERPHIGDVAVTQMHGNTIIAQYQASNQQPVSQRPIISRLFLFPLTVAAQHKDELFLKVVGRPRDIFKHAKIYEYELGFRILERQEGYELTIIGALLVLGIYNLILYLMLKDRVYLFYVFHVVVIVLLLMAVTGYLSFVLNLPAST